MVNKDVYIYFCFPSAAYAAKLPRVQEFVWSIEFEFSLSMNDC